MDLILMRHAKSDWNTGARDFDRPLNKRGEKTARFMGKWLRENYQVPDAIISSPALRAKQTVEKVCAAFGINTSEVIWDERIYAASLDELVSVLKEHVFQHGRVLMVGHNPGIEELLVYLIKETPDRDTKGKLMTTATIAVLKFTSGNTEKLAHSAELVTMERPRTLMSSR